jgi:hypothetical protein
MVARNTGKRVAGRHSGRHQSPFDAMDFPGGQVVSPDTACNVVAVAKRRDGGTRYWCKVHRADATAKYGNPASKCRSADEPPLRPEEILAWTSISAGSPCGEPFRPSTTRRSSR